MSEVEAELNTKDLLEEEYKSRGEVNINLEDYEFDFKNLTDDDLQLVKYKSGMRTLTLNCPGKISLADRIVSRKIVIEVAKGIIEVTEGHTGIDITRQASEDYLGSIKKGEWLGKYGGYRLDGIIFGFAEEISENDNSSAIKLSFVVYNVTDAEREDYYSRLNQGVDIFLNKTGITQEQKSL